jgi:hypothetical protein
VCVQTRPLHFEEHDNEIIEETGYGPRDEDSSDVVFFFYTLNS